MFITKFISNELAYVVRSMQKRRRDSRKLVVSKIHSHLKRFMLEATFLVERLLVQAAIKNDLIASHRTCMLRQEADDSLSQMLPTSAGIHNNVLNVPNFAAISQKFLLNKHAPRCNDLSRSLVFNHADKVIISNGTELSKSILEVCVRVGIANAELLQQLTKPLLLSEISNFRTPYFCSSPFSIFSCETQAESQNEMQKLNLKQMATRERFRFCDFHFTPQFYFSTIYVGKQ